MAGRGKTQTPGKQAFKQSSDNLLRAAARLDGIEVGVGDRLREEGAAALKAVVARALRKSESETNRRTDATAY